MTLSTVAHPSEKILTTLAMLSAQCKKKMSEEKESQDGKEFDTLVACAVVASGVGDTFWTRCAR
jgi:hypothetical protein